MTTAREIVTDALDLLMIHAAEEPLTAHQEQQGLRVLNDVIASASLEHFLIYYTPPVVLAWPAGITMRTWGPGGAILAPERPLQLGLEATRLEFDRQQVLNVLRIDEYRTLPDIGRQNDPVQAVSYAADYPLGRIFVYPTPLTPVQITVYPWLVLQRWPDFDTDILLPPGYSRYLKAAEACDLAPYYDKTPSDIVQAIRMEARDRLKTVNLTIPKLDVPPFADPYSLHSSTGDIWSWPR